jgi:hypothetical protein
MQTNKPTLPGQAGKQRTRGPETSIIFNTRDEFNVSKFSHPHLLILDFNEVAFVLNTKKMLKLQD